MDGKVWLLWGVGLGSIAVSVVLIFIKMAPMIVIAPMGVGAVVMIVLLFVKLPDRLPNTPANGKGKKEAAKKGTEG